MYEYYFTFGTITAAQSVIRALDHDAIPNRLSRTPKDIQMQGCGYSVIIRSGYYYQTKDLLEKLNLTSRHIFCRFADGSFEEVVE